MHTREPTRCEAEVEPPVVVLDAGRHARLDVAPPGRLIRLSEAERRHALAKALGQLGLHPHDCGGVPIPHGQGGEALLEERLLVV